jgi:hypothetical protein
MGERGAHLFIGPLAWILKTTLTTLSIRSGQSQEGDGFRASDRVWAP